MNFFNYQAGELFAEQVPILKITEQFGTPSYIYSRAAIEHQWQAFEHAFSSHPHRICYAVKANSNIAILNILAQMGAGFDVTSGGELARVLAAGGKPEKIIFSGIGKSSLEIENALKSGIYCFNAESKSELTRISNIAKQLGKRANIALRINPDIDAATHPHIATGLKENKFGIPIEDALETYVYAQKLPNLEVVGIASHIGSQLLTIEPFLATLDRLLNLIVELQQRGINIRSLDLGGGLGVCYHNENPPTIAVYAKAILTKLAHSSLELVLEPGRVIVADAGILVTKVEYLKHQGIKNFAVVDAAMNDLMRPALYDAWHGIIPIQPRTDDNMQLYDVVGPVCETSDTLGKTRHLCLKEGDLLSINGVGAYGFVMSSNYNSRPRVAEILVANNKIYLIREREKMNDLFLKEKLATD